MVESSVYSQSQVDVVWSLQKQWTGEIKDKQKKKKKKTHIDHLFLPFYHNCSLPFPLGEDPCVRQLKGADMTLSIKVSYLL